MDFLPLRVFIVVGINKSEIYVITIALMWHESSLINIWSRVCPAAVEALAAISHISRDAFTKRFFFALALE